MTVLQRAQQALRDEGRDGWLVYNVYHRDHVADRLFGVSEGSRNTRPWLGWIPANGEPQGLVHGIEAGALGSGLPIRTYTGASELAAAVATWLGEVSSYALNYSAIPPLSVIDHATVEWLRRLAPRASQHSADTLVQRTLASLDDTAIASHRAAADHLYQIVEAVWRQLGERLASGTAAGEGDVQRWILDALDERNLATDHAPIVAVGEHTSDPHYEPVGEGAAIRSDQVLQLDLWAKERHDDAVYADISWVGFTGTQPPPEVRSAFDAVVAARDEVVAAAAAALAGGRRPSGAELDACARVTVSDRGLGGHLRHRTGHAIDRLLHGIGVNLDGYEFPDDRTLLDGSCFSIEPGVYGVPLAQGGTFGVRTEIDAYVAGGSLVVSGGHRQSEPLIL